MFNRLWLPGLAGLILLMGAGAFARDVGQFTTTPDPAIRDWIRSLSDQDGHNCCDFADGTRLEDPDWECHDDTHCAVRIDGDWITVPEKALLKSRNRLGFAIVWRFKDSDGHTKIRCFLKGSES